MGKIFFPNWYIFTIVSRSILKIGILRSIILSIESFLQSWTFNLAIKLLNWSKKKKRLLRLKINFTFLLIRSIIQNIVKKKEEKQYTKLCTKSKILTRIELIWSLKIGGRKEEYRNNTRLPTTNL